MSEQAIQSRNHAPVRSDCSGAFVSQLSYTLEDRFGEFDSIHIGSSPSEAYQHVLDGSAVMGVAPVGDLKGITGCGLLQLKERRLLGNNIDKDLGAQNLRISNSISPYTSMVKCELLNLLLIDPSQARDISEEAGALLARSVAPIESTTQIVPNLQSFQMTKKGGEIHTDAFVYGNLETKPTFRHIVAMINMGCLQIYEGDNFVTGTPSEQGVVFLPTELITSPQTSAHLNTMNARVERLDVLPQLLPGEVAYFAADRQFHRGAKKQGCFDQLRSFTTLADLLVPK